jgi:transposase
MEVVHSRCGGLDVHKETVVACVRVIEGGKVRQEVRTFSTITKSLYELAEWLLAEQVMAVAMEATGVYWKPVWHVLEASGLSLVLANAAHIKAVPGRKTDVNDAMWIADLLAHGYPPRERPPPLLPRAR